MLRLLNWSIAQIVKQVLLLHVLQGLNLDLFNILLEHGVHEALAVFDFLHVKVFGNSCGRSHSLLNRVQVLVISIYLGLQVLVNEHVVELFVPL